jgi:hypothetical protein
MNPLRTLSDKEKSDLATRRTGRTKPNGPANSTKDFNDVLRSQEQDAVLSVDEAQSSDEAAMGQPSLFDLSAQSRKSKGQLKEEIAAGEDVAKMASSDELPTESSGKSAQLKDLYEKIGTPKPFVDQCSTDLSAQADSKAKDRKFTEEVGIAKGDIHEKEQKSPSFARESTDLSYVNPLSINTQNSIESVADQAKAVPAQKMTTQQLVDAIVKAVSTVAYEGKTDTVVTLKQPPLFEGANIVLTSYESAKGQFNIRFENLSQGAKSFMDMQQNKDSLLFALQQKGYAVHILVSTTMTETPKFVETAQQTQKDSNAEDQGQNPKQKKKNKGEE